MSDIDMEYEEGEDEDSIQERLAIMDEARTEAEKLIDGFRLKMDEARQTLELHGELVGLCPTCLDTNREVKIDVDGYEGMDCRLDNGMRIPQRCYHGEDRTEDFAF